MFDRPEIDAYRKVTAPPGLRERVMSMADAPGTTAARRMPARFISMAAAAACLLLVLTGVLLIPNGDSVTVSMNGQVVTAQPVGVSVSIEPAAALMVRELPPVSLTLEVNAREETRIAVSSGYVVIASPEDNTLTSGTDCTAQGVLTVEWLLPLFAGERQTLTVGDNTYCLEMAADGCCQIYRLEA